MTHAFTVPQGRDRGAAVKEVDGSWLSVERAAMTIDPRLQQIVAAQPYPLLFATISGARLFRFLSLTVLWVIIVAVTGCSAVSPLRESGERDPGAVVAEAERIADKEFALPKPSSSQPVRAAMRIVPTEVGEGGAFEILVRLEIAGAHHIYASNIVGKPFIPISLNVTLPEGIEALSDWIAPAPNRTKTGELVYTDSVSFRRSLRVGSNVPAGPLSIKGELRYQVCTEELCWPPRTIKLSSSVTISSPRK